MMLQMEIKNHLVDSRILSAIEQYWGFKLPKDYREFIINYNGGVTKKKYFKSKNGDKEAILDYLFGLINDFNNDISMNLLMDFKDVGGRYPSSMIPIGDTVGGDRILLSIKNKDRGKIYFWDHEIESEEDEEPDYSNLTLIADNFDEFINGLYSEQDIDLSEE